MMLASFVEEASAANGGMAWLTSQGTLSRRASWKVQDICAALELHPSDCADEVNRRRGPFRTLAPEVAGEANLLLRKCSVSTPVDQCREIIEDERFKRDSAIGEIQETTPDEMVEGEESTFTITIERKVGTVATGVEGIPEPGSSADPATGRRPAAGDNIVHFTRKTCFQLDGGDDFLIEDNEEPQCPPYNTNGSIVFIASWDVTPLKSGPQRRIKVYRYLYRGDRLIGDRQRQKPFPIEIDVKPAKGRMEKLREWFEEATDLTVSATGFVTAIGGLITAIAGLSIWGWFRRRKRKRNQDGQPPAPS